MYDIMTECSDLSAFRGHNIRMIVNYQTEFGQEADTFILNYKSCDGQPLNRMVDNIRDAFRDATNAEYGLEIDHQSDAVDDFIRDCYGDTIDLPWQDEMDTADLLYNSDPRLYGEIADNYVEGLIESFVEDLIDNKNGLIKTDNYVLTIEILEEETDEID